MNGTHIIERTFLHLPGIGPVKERSLWTQGIRTWSAFASAIQAGSSLGDVLRRGQALQCELFPDLARPVDPAAEQWLVALRESEAALRGGTHAFFLARLPPAEHWRVLASVLDEALYLDIETTGLSRNFNQITVIGALFRGRFHQWVWPQPVDELAELLRTAPIVVTFNGARFDLPFLQAHLPLLPEPRAHIDLMPIAGACEATGGQKAIERQFELVRDDTIREMDGFEAVLLWAKSVYGDAESYERLLYYNRTDVEMLPLLAARLCEVRLRETDQPMTVWNVADSAPSEIGHAPSSFAQLRRVWTERQVGLPRLLAKLSSKLGRVPVVVGIDLRGNPKNPTGWVRCEGARAECRVAHDDDEIVKLTLEAKPDLVSIDAPLSLPRGRVSVSDDSPCRAVGGIVREAERVLWSRGIRVYPALIRHMQGLTQRGIELTAGFRNDGLEVIESYPGAAQDILGIPRKGADVGLLRQGLAEFGFSIEGMPTHDELDAVTSALVGFFYMADEYEGVGAIDEGFLIVPRWSMAKGWALEGGR